jgi:putative cell wall-binding protein
LEGSTVHVAHHRRPVDALRGGLVALLVLALAGLSPTAVSAQEAPAGPPDRLDPPAEGEGPYPDDPSEPDDVRSFAAHPSPRYTVAGSRFPAQAVHVIAGSNRFSTSVEASRNGWPNGAPAAVLATGEAHSDALAASVLAGTVRGPLLLTPTGRLEPSVAAELRRLQPRTVHVVGQLSAAVEREVAALGLATERVGAEDRYRTAFAIAQRAVALGADPSTVIVASGVAFPDALSASALAAGLRIPILLVPSSGGAADLRARVEALGARRVWVIGGTNAIPDETVAGLPGLERLAGTERTATALAVADRAKALGLRGAPTLASAESFPDGLSGGVLAGASRGGPVLLTYRAELSDAPRRWIAANSVGRLDLLGGPAAVSLLARCQASVGDTRAFLCIEGELRRQGYNTGTVDGRLDHQTVWAFMAFQKVAGRRPTGEFGEAEYRALLANPRVAPRRPDLGPNHVEIDIGRQLVYVVRDGRVAHVLHTSTGKPSTPTVRGTFTVYETRNVRQANRMYRPSFFHRGYAFHGYPEIPTYPASAGCARVYDGDMDFLWPFVQRGTRVASY